MFAGVELSHLIYSKWGSWVLAVLFLAAGCFFLLLFIPGLFDSYDLKENHAQVTAKVTESRISHGEWPSAATYDLRYSFQLHPRGQAYNRCERGPIGRNDVWTSLPKPAWDQAIQSGKIEVVYYPPDPRLNVSVSDYDSDVRIARFGIAFGSAILAASFGVVPASRWLRRKRGPFLKLLETTGPHIWIDWRPFSKMRVGVSLSHE